MVQHYALKIKKNGKKNQTVFHESNDTTTCPVQILARIVHDIWTFDKDENALLCIFKCKNNVTHVMSADITSMLRCAAKQIGLCKRGYPLNRISLHSLRSGGAMALKLGNMDIITIKKYSR